MKCEICNKNEATIIVMQVINGKPKNLYICDKCAGENDDENDFVLPISLPELFQAILGGLIGMEIQYSPHNPQYNENSGDEIKCEVCKTTYSEFKNTGKFGCENCYKTFKNQLDTVLKNIQGSNIHSGKVPSKQRESYNNRFEISNLKRQLQEAIKIEDYEKAANLRDQIRAMEKRG